MAAEHAPSPIPAHVFDVLKSYLEARASFSADDFAFIRAVVLHRHLAEWEFLQRGRRTSSMPSKIPDLLLIDGPSHVRLVEQVAGYAAAFRTGLQRHAAARGSTDRQLAERVGRRALSRILARHTLCRERPVPEPASACGCGDNQCRPNDNRALRHETCDGTDVDHVPGKRCCKSTMARR